MKDLIRTKTAANTCQVSAFSEFSGVDENLEFLREECCNKNQIINILNEYAINIHYKIVYIILYLDTYIIIYIYYTYIIIYYTYYTYYT